MHRVVSDEFAGYPGPDNIKSDRPHCCDDLIRRPLLKVREGPDGGLDATKEIGCIHTTRQNDFDIRKA